MIKVGIFYQSLNKSKFLKALEFINNFEHVDIEVISFKKDSTEINEILDLYLKEGTGVEPSYCFIENSALFLNNFKDDYDILISSHYNADCDLSYFSMSLFDQNFMRIYDRCLARHYLQTLSLDPTLAEITDWTLHLSPVNVLAGFCDYVTSAYDEVEPPKEPTILTTPKLLFNDSHLEE